MKNFRYFRPLKKLKSQDFYVYDTETGYYFIDEKTGEKKIQFELWARPEAFIFGVLYGIENGKEFIKIFRNPEQAKQEFKKNKYKNKIIFAHNAQYDLLATFGNIYKIDPNAIFNGKFIMASNGVCVFGDSYNLLQTSVKKLGKLVGIEKMELGENFIVTKADIEKAIIYCVTDCKIVYVALQKIFEESQSALTIGSLSLKIFKRHFQKQTYKISELSNEFFKAYYGGRTEAMFKGELRADVYDINSAYPWAMLNSKFPNPETFQKKIITTSELKYYLDNYEGMITCSVKYKKDIHIPVLPVRMENKLMFPLGEFSGSWCFNEFRYALNFVDVIGNCEIIFSKEIENPFDEFITYYYNKRQKTNDDFEKYYFKLFMNNLYGKLVQRIDEKYIFIENENNVRSIMKRFKSKWAELIEADLPDHKGFFLKMKLPESFTSHTVACWGAYITAAVRVNLHETMYPIEKYVMYCDTDSIATTKKIPDKFLGNNLGQWKKENYTMTKIRSPKDYEYEKDGTTHEKIKGVKLGSERLPDNKEGKPVYLIKKLITTKESYKRKDKFPAGVFITQKKVISGDYDKRIVFKNGKTKPIKL